MTRDVVARQPRPGAGTGQGGAVSPVSRRTGRRYAAGSAAKFDGYPRVCSGCGLPVRITGPAALWFETGQDRVKRSWHFDCYPRERRD